MLLCNRQQGKKRSLASVLLLGTVWLESNWFDSFFFWLSISKSSGQSLILKGGLKSPETSKLPAFGMRALETSSLQNPPLFLRPCVDSEDAALCQRGTSLFTYCRSVGCPGIQPLLSWEMGGWGSLIGSVAELMGPSLLTQLRVCV